MKDQNNLDVIYSTLSLLSKNEILNFIMRMENLNFDNIQDRILLLTYTEQTSNFIKVCDNFNFEDQKEKLKKIKLNLISRMNKIFDSIVSP